MVIGGVWAANKAKELGVDFNENPEKAAAEMIVNLNPELEKVSSDDEAGTITFRNKDGGEVTLTYKDIQEGRTTPAVLPDPPAGE